MLCSDISLLILRPSSIFFNFQIYISKICLYISYDLYVFCYEFLLSIVFNLHLMDCCSSLCVIISLSWQSWVDISLSLHLIIRFPPLILWYGTPDIFNIGRFWGLAKSSGECCCIIAVILEGR